ncbi:type II toxin-antitoxin system VapC family toxin [Pseudothauera nasutitermitis]|uniref:Ribonuclease VapC n=1 Tax=Pseudothauera nasutitermitis TaxID=2565930 RepID=A0A4S4B079_9RHOO|nr:type II toxin-antitoxin system VapC family toxin [Pseudothauera nasutitermitis]THF65888.1 type II toxin-antitoxin system VapC family toxin [Pseudothauera nasutitermitis]
MAALDTNVLVRLLVEDDVAQLAAAKKLISQCMNAGETLHVPVTVMLELEWVLRSSFGFAKATVVHTLAQLLSSAELTFESEGAVELALAHYSQGTADYSDCLHVALAGQAGEQPLWTFDKAAAKVDGARLLPA